VSVWAQTGAAKPAASDTVPLATYTDPAHGVSFRYPVVWKRVRQLDDYCQSALFSDKLRPTAAVEFTGGGNYYRNTILGSLDFQYGIVRNSSPATCRKLVDDYASAPDWPASDKMVNSIAFRHVSGGECGLGHGISWELYTTFRNGNCFVFEEDFTTARPDNARELTPGEMKALLRHLDAIMRSVTFEGAGGR